VWSKYNFLNFKVLCTYKTWESKYQQKPQQIPFIIRKQKHNRTFRCDVPIRVFFFVMCCEYGDSNSCRCNFGAHDNVYTSKAPSSLCKTLVELHSSLLSYINNTNNLIHNKHSNFYKKGVDVCMQKHKKMIIKNQWKSILTNLS
jgi:hypothetical protein